MKQLGIEFIRLNLTIGTTTAVLGPVYDNGGQLLATVECSDGKNSLLTKGFKTFQDLPPFPNIGRSSVIAGWNSPSCGSSLPYRT